MDPVLSDGRRLALELPGRGTLTVWDHPGPLGSPTLVLVPGVTLTARLNWGGVVGTLQEEFRVLTLDLRGHGDGPRTAGSFRLADCADDVAAVAAALDTGPVVVAGYSLGGMVAQLFWHRHPRRAAGLVLCSTARNVAGSPTERAAAMLMPGMLATAAAVPAVHLLRADVVGAGLLDGGGDPATRRRALAEMRRTPLLTALSAMQAAAAFSSHSWIHTVDVPSAMVITRHDRVVAPRRQWKLAHALPGCTVVEIDGGHGAFLDTPGPYAVALRSACRAVLAGGHGGVDVAS